MDANSSLLTPGTIIEYSLLPNETSFRGNTPGKQAIRIESTANDMVHYSMFASGVLIPVGGRYPVAEFERFLKSREAVETTIEVEGVAVTAEPVKSGPVGPTLQDLCLAALEGGTRLTSEVAKVIGKPVAAANSALGALAKRGVVSMMKGDSGVEWTLVGGEVQ